MELSDYLQLAKRNWKVLVAIPLVLALGAFLNANRSPKQYQSTTTVLLKPNDPNERIGSTGNLGSATELVNSSRIVKSLANIADGPMVAEAAAKLLGGDATPTEIGKAISVATSDDSNIMKIKATTRSGQRSAAIANAVADAYIDNRRQASIAGLDRAITKAKDNLVDLDTKIKNLGRAAPSAATDTELGTVRSEYQEQSQRKAQLEFDKELKRGEAEVIADAKPSESAVSPKPLRSALAALLAGIILAAGIVLLKDRLDLRLRSRDEAEELSSLPTLAEIPIDRRMSKDPFHIAALEHPDGLLAEAVRSLRVSMRFISLEQPLRVLLVTSAMPADGKSTVATNLAASYAVSGARTLLISADLRRPRVDDFAESQGASGLVEILTGIAEEEERRQRRARRVSNPTRPPAPRRDNSNVEHYPAAPTRRRKGDDDTSSTGIARTTTEDSADRDSASKSIEIANFCYVDSSNGNLWVLPAGQPVANPVEILGSPVAKDFFAAAREQFDMVIVDSPPVLPVSDSLVMSSHVDGVAFVCSLRQTNYKHLARGVERLRSAQAPLVGIVVNRVPKDIENSYYGRNPTP